MAIRLQDSVEARFLEEVCANYPGRGQNTEARALFICIQTAFTKNGVEKWDESIMVHPEMIAHLAACTWVALDYDPEVRIPWDDGAHDYILTRTLRYFMSTLREAIEEGQVSEVRGDVMHGCFTIPRWYYNQCKSESRTR
jgi:hypothetical protein